jgi:hypothetical protein
MLARHSWSILRPASAGFRELADVVLGWRTLKLDGAPEQALPKPAGIDLALTFPREGEMAKGPAD